VTPDADIGAGLMLDFPFSGGNHDVVPLSDAYEIALRNQSGQRLLESTDELGVKILPPPAGLYERIHAWKRGAHFTSRF